MIHKGWGWLVVPWGLSFPTGGTRSSGGTCPHGDALSWERGKVVSFDHFSYSVCLVLYGAGVALFHPCGLGLSLWYFVLE